MHRILVTGANKGIGLAVVEAILTDIDDATVVLAARDRGRGQAAIDGLVEAQPASHSSSSSSGLPHSSSWRSRLELLELDVSQSDSVAQAAAELQRRHGDTALTAIVNNAGIAEADLQTMFAVNTRGVRSVCQHFMPLLAPEGRVVNVTSASGPNYVAACAERWQSQLCDPDADWSAIEQFMHELQAMTPAERSSRGLPEAQYYGASKACANWYTLVLARQYPNYRINACTPGYIETDLTRQLLANSGRSVAAAGLKQPADGARVILQLLTTEDQHSGRYYGSDGLRSPLDAYRAPGSPEYKGA